jgi:hypothetical protein
MKNCTLLDSLDRRYVKLKRKMGEIGLILQGTITPRTIISQDPNKPGKKKLLGPYYQWTFKENGKTITINLTASQAHFYQKAIDNYRKIRNVIQKMKDISLQICNNSFEGVKKRNAGINLKKPLS